MKARVAPLKRRAVCVNSNNGRYTRTGEWNIRVSVSSESTSPRSGAGRSSSFAIMCSRSAPRRGLASSTSATACAGTPPSGRVCAAGHVLTVPKFSAVSKLSSSAKAVHSSLVRLSIRVMAMAPPSRDTSSCKAPDSVRGKSPVVAKASTIFPRASSLLPGWLRRSGSGPGDALPHGSGPGWCGRRGATPS